MSDGFCEATARTSTSWAAASGAKGTKAEEAKSNGLYTKHVYSLLMVSRLD